MSSTQRLQIAFLLLTVSIPPGLAVAGDAGAYWPTWRGPTGNGVSPEGDPPIEWSETENIRWKVEIPGLGSASPVI